jgi:aspartate/methionine/tyrosine aminotransferase
MPGSTMPILNPLVAGQPAPPVPAVQAWAAAYDERQGPLMDLSQAVPGYPPHNDLLGWLAEAAGSPRLAGYGAIEGEAELRNAYSRHVSVLYGATVAAANIHITAGCNQAFFATAIAVGKAGDTFLMTNPCYFNHETTLAMLGIGIRHVECRSGNGFLPDVSEISAALGSGGIRALALVTPNNPAGAIYPAELLKDIFDLCRKNGVWLILDETYRDFLPPGAERPHTLMSEPNWDQTLIQLYSFSKSFCIPGHRVGAVTAGPKVVEQIAKIMDNLQICAPRPPQAAIAKALPALADWHAWNRRDIADRTRTMRQMLANVLGWELQSIGAYFAYVRHPYGAKSSLAVAEKLAIEAGVLVIPGEFFGTGQEPFLRFAFANARSDTIRKMGHRLAKLK